MIYFGNGPELICSDTGFIDALREADIEVLTYCGLDTVNIDDIINLAFGLPNATQAVIGLGGGKVIDAAKYIGFLRKLPFISVPTSASSDGFSSASASLIVNGRRNSVPRVWHSALSQTPRSSKARRRNSCILASEIWCQKSLRCTTGNLRRHTALHRSMTLRL